MALVHRLLDQRVAAQRTYDEQARHIGFISFAKRRHCVGIAVGECHPEALYQATGRCRPQTGNNSVHRHGLLTFGAFVAVVECGLSLFGLGYLLDCTCAGVVEDTQIFVPVCRKNLVQVAFFTAGKFIFAVDQHHLVVLHQGQGVFNGGITRTDHNDGFIVELVGVSQGVLNIGKVVTSSSNFSDIAL